MASRLLAVNIGDLPLTPAKTLSQSYGNLSVLISLILRNALTLAGILFLCLLIYGGLGLIMTAGSEDAKKLQAAKDSLTTSLIGFVVVFSAYFIIQILEVITGLKILNPTI